MPGPLIVGAEGVILTPDEAYAASRPINEGLEMVMQLEKFPTSSLIIICNTDMEREAQYWIRMNGLPQARIALTAVEDREETAAAAQWAVIQRERAKGPINLVLTSYKEVYTHCIQTHQSCLLYGRKGALSTLGEAPSWSQVHDRVLATKEARLDDGEENIDVREGF